MFQRRSLLRRRSWGAALALLAAACTGTGAQPEPTASLSTAPPTARPTPTADADQPRYGGSLRIGLSSDPTSLDPRHVTDDDGLLVVDALFDSLTRVDAAAVAEPSLATGWDVSADGLTWTFRLDPTATFHDGTPVVAADVIRAWNSIVDGGAERPSYAAAMLEAVAGFDAAQAAGGGLAGLRAVDDRTLEVTLSRPEPEFAEIVAHPSLAPIPATAQDDPETWAQAPVGNGPFEMAEPWAHNQFIRLSRAGSGPYVEEVLFRIYADDPGQAQQFDDFRSGQLHVAKVPPAEQDFAVEEYGRGDRGLLGPGVLDGPRAAAYLYGFNVNVPPFDDPQVRRAVSMLIDRTAIADEAFLGTRVPATSMVPAGIPSAQVGACDVCTFDPDRGIALLSELLPPPQEREPVVVVHNAGETHADVADRIARSLETAGFEVEVRERALVALVAAVQAGEAHLYRWGLTVDHLSGSAFLRPLFHSSGLGSTNLTGYSNPTVDDLLDLARGTADRAERRVHYRAAELAILEDLPMLPLVTFRHDLVVADDVRGFVIDPVGRVDLSVVWLATQ